MKIGNLEGRLVLIDGSEAIDVERASNGRLPSDPQSVWAQWPQFQEWASRASWDSKFTFDYGGLEAPVPFPRQVFAAGLNYASHAGETEVAVPQDPVVFAKFPTCLTGPTGTIQLPSGGSTDWEVEIVAVIGREAHGVDPVDAWSAIAGLTLGQDLSERRRQLAGPIPQFGLAKSFPGFGPTGPWLVTVDEFADRDNIRFGCDLNGSPAQVGSTQELIFSIPELVAALSGIVKLLPGDLIFTGTPSGVGMARTPPRFLTERDALRSWAEGIGEMHHTFR